MQYVQSITDSAERSEGTPLKKASDRGLGIDGKEKNGCRDEGDEGKADGGKYRVVSRRGGRMMRQNQDESEDQGKNDQSCGRQTRNGLR